MAETATDSTSNGTKLDDVKASEPVKEVVVAGAEIGDKAAAAARDLNPGATKVLHDKVVEDTSPAESTIKAVTKASDEAGAKETSDLKKTDDAEPTKEKEGLKTTVEVNIGKTNAKLPQTDSEETKANDSIDTQSKEENVFKIEKEAEVVAYNSSKQKDPIVEEGKPEAMDIDDKKQEKIEAKVEPKVEQHAVDAGTPKKKLGRPKKIRDPEGPKVEQKTPVSEIKKRPRQKKVPVTPLSGERDRPARERKSIERFVASIEKDKRKELVIKQGTGTALMDIPNVAFKLSKRSKGDEILNMLHSLLYNKRAKATVIKHNIFKFSGYVWTENEEKERNRVREKLERFTKEGLGQLLDLLDLHLNKAGKKEELVGKVLEFLESPHKTTEVSIEEREQRLKEKKRKGRTPGRGRGPGRKRQKTEDYSTSKKRGRRKKNETDDETEGEYANSDDESLEEEEEVERKRLTFVDDHDDGEYDDANDEDYDATKKPQKRPTKVSKDGDKEPAEGKVSNDEEDSEGDQAAKRSAAKFTSSASTKTPMPSSPDITKSSSKPADKVYTKGSRKKSKELKEKEKEKEKEKPAGKRMNKQKSISKEKGVEKTGRGRGRGKAKDKGPPLKKKKTAEIPSDEVLQNEIRGKLQGLAPADFSKVTFMDIVVQLEDKFNIDLSVKKAHVKALIRHEVSRLAEEVDEEDEDQEGEEAGDAKIEPETEPEGEAYEAAEKAEQPDAEEAAEEMDVDVPGDSDAGDSAKEVEAEALDEEVTEVPSKAGSTKGRTEDRQTAALAEITIEKSGGGD